MKRIHKERDRLLRRLARTTAIVGSVGAFACLLVPGTTAGSELAVATALSIGIAALAVVHTVRGSLAAAIVLVAASVVLVFVLGSASVLDPGASTALAVTGGVTSASVAPTLVVRPRGPVLVGTLAAVVLVGEWAAALWFGHDLLAVAVVTAVGWAVLAVLAGWLDNGVGVAAARIAEVGRAHEAERLASELEAQQRQDARVLHDTVLATLSLLAHSGVGVGAGALRDQAGDDARLLRQLRLGVPLDGGSNAIFSPGSDDDLLSTTFESVRQRFARMGLDVSWHGAAQLALPREHLDALVGALGECLENVRRHSGVFEADVTITDDEHTVRAMVTDAGDGFEPAGIDPARLGFAESVVGRLQAVGGRARVFSSPGSGTTVMLEVPKA
ncbi:signal transduction histidine kinase [Agromyces terreus]|uniref:Signal transduction histidine kinase n=1 Tax=Agromyces terreus TaxID=424795 RepID=A0A9X2KC82_9MICO|nr:ATP-binding protein [Agromyces terreus]MCP2371379.1 signal transduction histidine kinase [Agromyces terreus]